MRMMTCLGLAVLAVSASVAIAAEIDETEPNGTVATGNPLAAGDVGVGDISPAGDHDVWVTPAASVGDQIFALVETVDSSTGEDALLIALDANAAVIRQDDNDGPDVAPALAGEVVPVAGEVSFEIFELDNNGTITPYRLFHLVADPATSVPETEPNDAAGQANAVAGASLATGDVAPAATDFFAVSLAAGDALAAVLDRDPDDNATFVASQLAILDVDGTTVLANADAVSGDGHAVGPIRADVAGTYYVRIGNAGGGSDDDYRVAFVTTVPEPGALAAAVVALCALARRCTR